MTARVDVVFLGFTLPAADRDALDRMDPVHGSQTQTLALAVITALQQAGLTVHLLSAESVSCFPALPRVVFRSRRFMAEGVPGQTLFFLNLLGFKHLTRFLSCLWTGTRTLRATRAKVLLIHGVHSPFLWFGALARKFLGVSAIVILTDPPGVVVPTDGRLARALKAVDIPIVRAGLQRTDGVVAFTADLAEEFAAGRPKMIMEGIFAAPDQPDDRVPPMTDGARRPRLIYAGALTEEYGVGRLVNAVLHWDPAAAPNIPPPMLQCYGKGSFAESIEVAARISNTIGAPQFLPRSEILRAYRGADLLVQPRPCDHPAAGLSFPSKLLEYMASGTPVLTTRLPGIPPDYEPYVYWMEDDSSEGIRRAIRDVLSIPADQRRSTGRSAAEFILRTRGSATQGERLREFFAAAGPR